MEKTLHPGDQFDLACFKIKRKRGVEKIVSRGAVRCRSSVLASLHICGRSVVVAGTNEERTALRINRRRLPNCTAAVSPRPAAIVRYAEGFPKHRTRFLIERYDTAAKTATRIRWVEVHRFFVR